MPDKIPVPGGWLEVWVAPLVDDSKELRVRGCTSKGPMGISITILGDGKGWNLNGYDRLKGPLGAAIVQEVAWIERCVRQDLLDCLADTSYGLDNTAYLWYCLQVTARCRALRVYWVPALLEWVNNRRF